ncbi:MAG: CTP synthase, partial [Patescibacteria group bacterium]
HLVERIQEKLNLPKKELNVELKKKWDTFIDKTKITTKKARIGIVGKYFNSGEYALEDSYVCVIESLKHAFYFHNSAPDISWISSEDIERNGTESLSQYDGIIVPQGWGSRGTEGMIATIQYAREHSVPFLGLCFGMQMATVEFARNVLNLKKANSVEADEKTPYPVIHIMPHQTEYLKKNQYGGTIRLGAWPALIKLGTQLADLYNLYKNDQFTLPTVEERHRHRYEFNNEYKKKFENAGMVISATSPDGKLVEAVELPSHPFFIGVQYHPELKSRPLSPHPIFVGFVKVCIKKKTN